MVQNRQRKVKVDRRPLERLIERLKEEFGVENKGVTVVLVSDRKIKELNRTYRGRNRPTDVLSFSYDDESYLGDIIISVETAQRQAQEEGHSLERELSILVIHGFLHLLGYDHETDQGEMRALERKLWKKLLN